MDPRQLQRGLLCVATCLLCVQVVLVSCLGAPRRQSKEGFNYHSIYAREAKPYSNIKYDKALPYVPRYRYPISKYTGKRGDESVERTQSTVVDPRSFQVLLGVLRRYFSDNPTYE